MIGCLYSTQMSGNLNGDKLIDLDLVTLTGDLPEATLTLREPYVMMYSLSRTSDGAELMLDWDRNDPNSNLRVTSRFTDSSDSSSIQHDLDVKVSRPKSSFFEGWGGDWMNSLEQQKGCGRMT